MPIDRADAESLVRAFERLTELKGVQSDLSKVRSGRQLSVSIGIIYTPHEETSGAQRLFTFNDKSGDLLMAVSSRLADELHYQIAQTELAIVSLGGKL